MIACPDCGSVEAIPRLPPRSTALCRTCRAPLERTAGRSLDAALACALATLLLLFPMNLMPLASVGKIGIERRSLLASGVFTMWREGSVLPAILIGAFAVVLPFARFGLLTASLGALRLGRRPPWAGRAFRWAMHLDLWAMPDVFLLGAAVGYSRVAVQLNAQIGMGGWCLIGAAFLCMLSRATLDARAVWRRIGPERDLPADTPVISCTSCDLLAPADAEGQSCPRCGLTLRARKPDAMIRTTALTVASFLLYFPANLYPMSETIEVGKLVQHRIIDGVIDLFQAGFYPIGALIFCTSIMFPFLKLLALSWFLLSVRRRSRERLVWKTKIFRIVDELGRWSNIDVFTIAVFVPLIQFRPLAVASSGPGSPAFILVVVLTMLATRTFDPRLMWDAAGEARR
jgi:paraquat-inducible protein A